MHRTLCATIILAGIAAHTNARAQFNSPAPSPPGGLDLALTYASDRARLAPGNCGCFWLQGGTVDAALSLGKGFGIAASVAGDRIASYAPGIDFNKMTYLAGPRYSWTTHRLDASYPPGHHLQFFGEGLFGIVHAFSGTFPSSTGVTTSASSFALQTGGGINLPLSQHFGLRLAQADYVRTQLPNGFASTQNDLRLSTGLTFRPGPMRNRRLKLHLGS